MTTRKAQLEMTADGSQARADISQTKESLATLGKTGKSAGQEVASGLAGVGAAGAGASQKIDAATKNMVGSIQRATAVLEAGSRSNSKYFEVLADQRGINKDVLKPYLDQLDAVSTKARSAAQATVDLSKVTTSLGATSFSKSLAGVTTSLGATAFGTLPDAAKQTEQALQRVTAATATSGKQFNAYGLTAGQTTNALRQLPAQFTDIFVSLASGQQPLTVFLQQGGQIKDMFGGIGPAARAVGGALVNMLNPFTIAAAAAVALAVAYKQGSGEADAYVKALVMSGNAAGMTAGQLGAMAAQMSAVRGTQGAAAEALAQFAGASNIAAGSLAKFADVALQLDRTVGIPVKDTVKQFEELGKAPVEASRKLNESTNYLTTSVYQQIRALEEQGRVAEAGALAQNAYADAMKNRVADVEANLGSLETAWKTIADAAKRGWDAMLNVGREETLQQKLDAVNKKLQQSAAERESSRGMVMPRGGFKDDDAALRQQQADLQEQIRMEARAATLEGERKATERAGIAASDYFAKLQAGEKNARNLNKALAEYERNLEAVRKAGGTVPDAAQQDSDRAKIRDQYTNKGDASKAEQERKARLAAALDDIKKSGEMTLAAYANTEKRVEALRSAGLLDEQTYYAAKRQFVEDDTQAQQLSINAQIRRLEAEKASGAESIKIQKEIAALRTKSAEVAAEGQTKLFVLDLQEQAAIRGKEAALRGLRQAQEDYYQSVQRQQQRALDDFGAGNSQRTRSAGLNQIEDRYASQRRELENARAIATLGGKDLTDQQRKDFDDRLALIEEFKQKSIASYSEYYDALKAKQHDWSLGASEALANYRDDAQNIFKQTEGLVTDAFKGMEDSLVTFMKTGKLSFKSLADSIITDIIRIQAKQALLQLFGMSSGGGSSSWLGSAIGLAASYFGGSSGGAGVVSGGSGISLGGVSQAGAGGTDSMFSLVGGRLASGGLASAGGLFEVNEKGPELLSVAGRSYLMMGDQAGQVTPNSGGGAAPVINQTNNYTVGDIVTSQQLARVAEQTRQASVAAMMEARVRGRA